VLEANSAVLAMNKSHIVVITSQRVHLLLFFINVCPYSAGQKRVPLLFFYSNCSKCNSTFIVEFRSLLRKLELTIQAVAALSSLIEIIQLCSKCLTRNLAITDKPCNTHMCKCMQWRD